MIATHTAETALLDLDSHSQAHAESRPTRHGVMAWASLGLRLIVAVFLCTRFVTAVLVVGWTFRWMRRNVLRGCWLKSSLRAQLPWPQFAAAQAGHVPIGLSPRWLVHENARALWNAPRPDGRPAGFVRRLSRLPRIALGGLAANLCLGATALLATLIITAPGSFLMMAGWRYGWDISFHKVYEQAFIGRITFLIGALAFVTALVYLPMATAHLAATGDFRAFFQARIVRRLNRHARASITLLVALIAVLSLPLYVAWVRVYTTTNEFPALETASAEQLATFTESYVLNTAWIAVPAYLVVHLLAARIYRKALLPLLAREPALIAELPAALSDPLHQLGLVPGPSLRRRHFLVAAVVGTASRGTRTLLWMAQIALWLALLAQMLVAGFLHAHEFLIWFNPWLIMLPCPRWFLVL